MQLEILPTCIFTYLCRVFNYEITLFPTGVEHETYYCDICNPPGQWNACIKGIRWNCTECQDYDLCNTCYMNDEDDISHMFQRVMAPDKRYFIMLIHIKLSLYYFSIQRLLNKEGKVIVMYLSKDVSVFFLKVD